MPIAFSTRDGARALLPFSTKRGEAAFTLIELLASIGLLSVLLLLLASVTESAGSAWRLGRSRVDTFQSARTALEIVSRELTPAIVDTRTQFVVAPGQLLTDAGALQVAPESSALLWMAPIGENSELRLVGYYLYRDEARRFYRLKRLYAGPGPSTDPRARYFPINLDDPRDPQLRTSPIDAKWFTRNFNASAFDEEDATNEAAIVSTAADGVIAFWVQCIDLLGNPIPLLSEAKNHPSSELFYNSAAYIQFATTEPFEGGNSTIFLAETPESLKANRVPAAIDLTVVTLDSVTLGRVQSVPLQTNV